MVGKHERGTGGDGNTGRHIYSLADEEGGDADVARVAWKGKRRKRRVEQREQRGERRRAGGEEEEAGAGVEVGDERVPAAVEGRKRARLRRVAREQRAEAGDARASSSDEEDGRGGDEEDSEEGWEEVSGEDEDFEMDEEAGGDGDGESDYSMDSEEEAALERFIAAQGQRSGAKAKQVSIADLIMEKIRESEEARGGDKSGERDGEEFLEGVEGGSAWARRERQRQVWESKLESLGLEPKVIEVYTMVGKVLATYRSGKVPKAFKILPHLANWEHLIVVTDPDAWSDQATFVATRVFASSLNAALAQRFFNLVLLPKVRRQISETRRVSVHLYNALKKSLYKPAAFYKGVLLPLCASCTCSVREAVVLASILRKCTIPLLHSAAAIMKLCEMEYNATSSFFLRVLLDKRYALPYRVVDSVLAHFMAFLDDDRDMPLVWHQALLVFVQRYKNEILAEDKEALRHLMRAHTHHLVSDEIRRELNNSRSRGQAEAPGSARLPAVAAVMDIDPHFTSARNIGQMAIAGGKHMF